MNSTINLFKFLGWQGGNIHQVASVIQCDSHDLIYAQFNEDMPNNYLYELGKNWLNNTQAQRNRLFELNRGNLAYWLGVRDSQ